MRLYEETFVRKYSRKEKIPAALLALGLRIQDRVERRNGGALAEQEVYRALLLTEEVRRARAAKRAVYALTVILCGLVFAVTVWVVHFRKEALNRIVRPAFGEEKKVSVVVEGLSRDREITIPVSGKDPDETEADRVFDEAFQAMQTTWLNGNASFDEVRSRLELPRSTSSDIRIRYESETPDILSDYGMILAEELPEAGLPARLRITMSYGGSEKSYLQELRLLPAAEPPLTEEEKLKQLLKEMDEGSKEEAYLALPEEFAGQAIRFKAGGSSPAVILCLFLILAASIYILPNERVRKAYRERNREIESSYPNLLMKLETLIRAGLSIRSAWQRITEDYLAGLRNGSRKKEYVYEEMRITEFRMTHGESETEAYINFGRRMGSRSYVKLGTMLSQSVRQGISGLTDSFDEEMMHALEARKNAALKAGEETGTKVLFPMMLMLGVVIVSLVVPAFLTFYR